MAVPEAERFSLPGGEELDRPKRAWPRFTALFRGTGIASWSSGEEARERKSVGNEDTPPDQGGERRSRAREPAPGTIRCWGTLALAGLFLLLLILGAVLGQVFEIYHTGSSL